MISRRKVSVVALSLLAMGGFAVTSSAEETIKIGVIADFSGPFASVGERLKRGMEVYIDQHGKSVGGRHVEVIYRDVGNGNPAVAKQIAEELIVRDKVSLLAGFSVTPEAASVAPVATEARVPAVLMVPSTPALMKMSPFFVRSANNMISTTRPAAEWARKNGKSKAYIAVADFAPGHTVEAAFKKRFTELGGTIVGDDRMPVNTVDYAPFVERIVQSGADVLMLFVPTGTPSVSFIRALAASGAVKRGLVPIGIGETDEGDLPSFDESVIGVYGSFHWSAMLTYPETKTFLADYRKKYGPTPAPAPFTVAAYDGMHLLYQMIKSQEGKPFDGAAAIAAIKGYQWNSPRGPLEIDPASRDIIENMYIRRVDKVNGEKVNTVVDTFQQVKPAFDE